MSSECFSSFSFNSSQTIASLGLEVSEYTHNKTGAKHFHIAADHDEQVFLVAFRTMPTDSTGVAHILEHTALCGSKRYPVRDPFFMMTRRSLNTFMNAFTSSDWTAYPFASQNEKDFSNLLDVYLDACFFARLDELDFAQEGHRIEFSEEGNTDSPLVYKGVVFNEMKGAMSSVTSTLWQTLSKHLFSTTTYHHNSGGDPEAIPDLSYQQLKDFYEQHYHPSNAIFMTFGKQRAAQLQARFEKQVLQHFSGSDIHLSVPKEKLYYAPIKVEEAYAYQQEDTAAKTHHVMAWLLGDSTDLDAQLRAQLLSRLLLDNSASPLRLALETTELGSAVSPLCGLEDSNRQMSFICGLEGSEPNQAEAFQSLVMDCLEQLVEQGISKDVLEAQLHQLELEQREITGAGYPYGLSLILAALPSAIHRGDALAALNLDPALERLKKASQAEDFVQKLVQELLLNNQHRVRLTMRPDAELAQKRDEQEAANLAEIKAQLSETEAAALVQQASDLLERQASVDDEHILPKVSIADVPAQLNIAQPINCNNEFPLTQYEQGTNGLVYQEIIMLLPKLSDAELELLPVYTHLLTELGCAERDYLVNQQYQAQVTGGIEAYSSVYSHINDEQHVRGFLVLSAKALASKQEAMAELLQQTLVETYFSETARIKEIVAQIRTRKEHSITGRGHSLAMLAAQAKLSPAAALAQKTQGLASISFYKKLDADLVKPEALTELSQNLSALHEKIKAMPRQFLLVAETEQQQAAAEHLTALWQNQPVAKEATVFSLPATRENVKQLWLTNTQVNFCAKAYATVSVEHPDAAALTILGDFLRNGYLHTAIREQGGAYGSGAGQDCSNASFRFFSYRDPRLTETLDEFDKSIEWLLQTEHTEQQLEEAILGVISSMDKPSSPAGEAKQAFHAELSGRSAEQRKAFRQKILAVSIDDLKQVAKTYLQPENASIAVITQAEKMQDLAAEFEVINI